MNVTESLSNELILARKKVQSLNTTKKEKPCKAERTIFKVNDLVFAKVFGYSAWPAIVNIKTNIILVI